jgi:F5/8 type C domain
VWDSAPRRIRTYPAIWNSSADFIDLHPYPGGYNLGQLVENFEMQGFNAKPVLMGELGAARNDYASAARVALGLHDWQVDSCNYGFDGWLLWTWDSSEQAGFYNGLDDGGLINQALAPVNRPDPCAARAFEFFERNLALTSTPNASRWLGSNPPSFAINGTNRDWWSAGAFATQWIELDLGQPSTVRLIRLVVTQSPRGETRHELSMGAEHDNLTLVQTFEGVTDDQQVLEWRPETPLQNVRYVRITTRTSPSWIGWREIEVIAD